MTVWVVGQGTLGTALGGVLDDLGVARVTTGRHQVDITDAAAVAAFAGHQSFSHIFNCAAYTDVDRAERERAAAAAVNEQGVANLASSAYQGGAALVHLSTDYVFDGQATEPYDEEAPCRPLSVYGTTKRAGERALERALGGFERGAAAAYVVRTSWLFGPGGHDFVGRMFRRLRERDEVEVVSDQTGRPTSAPDLAQALVRLSGLTGPPASCGIYHFANAGETTWFELTRAIAVLAGVRCRVTPIAAAQLGRAARRPVYSVLATDKITRATGIEPRPWIEALGECIERWLGVG